MASTFSFANENIICGTLKQYIQQRIYHTAENTKIVTAIQSDVDGSIYNIADIRSELTSENYLFGDKICVRFTTYNTERHTLFSMSHNEYLNDQLDSKLASRLFKNNEGTISIVDAWSYTPSNGPN